MKYRDLDTEEFKAGLAADKDIILIDVRTAEEVAMGKLEGAIVIDFFATDFQQTIINLDKSKSYYIYCRSGNRSGQACQIMGGLGFEKLVNLAGGMLAWT